VGVPAKTSSRVTDLITACFQFKMILNVTKVPVSAEIAPVSVKIASVSVKMAPVSAKIASVSVKMAPVSMKIASVS